MRLQHDIAAMPCILTSPFSLEAGMTIMVELLAQRQRIIVQLYNNARSCSVRV